MTWRSRKTGLLSTLCVYLFSWSVAWAAPASSDTPSAASFFVHQIPGLKQDPAHPLHVYSGHLPSDPKTMPHSKEVSAHLFFVLVKARRSADRERVIFWFNGGPGCSSFDGLMMENGPWRMDGKGGLKLVEGGWEEYANVVYVDQPAGTGLSYTSTDKYLHDLDQAAQHVVQFLRNFYDVFPEYSDMETYLAGESFAGQYIPYIASEILKSSISTPLAGLAIGNGWIDGRRQYPAYIEFALQHKIIKEGSKDHKRSKEILEQCMKDLNSTPDFEPVSVGSCEEIMGAVTAGLNQEVDGRMLCMNVYDIRLSDTFPACGMNWPPDLAEVTPYLGRKDVVRALHATAKEESWTECSGKVGQYMTNRKSQSSVTLLPELLQKVPILLFSGDQDLICNHVGTERLIEALYWNSHQGLGEDAKTYPWSVNGTDAGTWVTSRNLTYAKVYGASHMVPYDLPHVAHDMMLRFMGVDFSALTGGTARIPSAIGDDVKPGFTVEDGSETAPKPGSTKTPEQIQAEWDAYYNAGTAALVLVLIALAIGLFFYFRARRRRGTQGVALNDEEETIPLKTTGHDHEGETEEEKRRRKGKGRAEPDDEEEEGRAIFDVGDGDSDNEK